MTNPTAPLTTAPNHDVTRLRRRVAVGLIGMTLVGVAAAGAGAQPKGATPTATAGQSGENGSGSSTVPKATEGSAGSGSAEPSLPPAEPASPPAESGSLDELRAEYLALRDALFASRARASAVASQLFSTKISIRFRFDSARYYGVPRAVIRLDGASVFDDTEAKIASDDAVRFTGYVAPGRHVVTFRVETVGKDDDRFGAANEATVSIVAVAGKDIIVTARAKDGGDIPYKWKKAEAGDYGLQLAVSVKTEKQTASKGANAGK